MYKLMAVVMLALVLAGVAEARGGFSSGGGRGGFSSAGRSSYAAPARSYASQRSVTTTTTTRMSSRSYGGSYVHSSGHYYGGMGMGYGYSHGLVSGLIIGSMMHPMNTVIYSGGGAYNNNALLYPDGRVVNQQGYVVGSYVDGAFTPIQNGPLVAQPLPQDVQVQQAQPVVVQDSSASVVVVASLLAVVLVLLLMLVTLL